MPVPEGQIAVAREWVVKAENDLRTAEYTLTMGERCPTDTVCFHAQQCVEKYLKALLVAEGVDFARTHDIAELMAVSPEKVHPVLDEAQQDRMTEYATVTRYPGAYGPISMEEARDAVEVARRAAERIRRLLPAGALDLDEK
ncbi:MAG: HEPN domain-containing protein [Candidatus Brocadiia bacterium]